MYQNKEDNYENRRLYRTKVFESNIREFRVPFPFPLEDARIIT